MTEKNKPQCVTKTNHNVLHKNKKGISYDSLDDVLTNSRESWSLECLLLWVRRPVGDMQLCTGNIALRLEFYQWSQNK